MSRRARVSVVKVEDFEDPYDSVKEAVRLAGGFEEALKASSNVTVKPNLVRIPKYMQGEIPRGAATSFQVLDAVLKLTKEKTSNVSVIESDTLLGTAEQAFEKYRLYELAKRYGLRLVNATKDELVECEVPDPQFYVALNGLSWLDPPEREMFASDYVLRLPRSCLNSFRISVPSMKTQADPYSAITFSVKNMFGVLPEVEKFKKFHEIKSWKGNKYNIGINVGRAVLDICQVAPPNYAIIDGLWGLHGPGSPGTGKSVRIGVVIASSDAWAADTVAGAVVGFDMRRLFYFRKAELMGLGVTSLDKIEVVGEDLESVKVSFELAVSLEAQRLLDEVVGR
ncbi:DUF362 domain-containing protein [Candidatus Bathyarchaeota archaeon]|nr:DUF362 domain-containing protein [Candidatus Bathyarchaeota archaeon]